MIIIYNTIDDVKSNLCVISMYFSKLSAIILPCITPNIAVTVRIYIDNMDEIPLTLSDPVHTCSSLASRNHTD